MNFLFRIFTISRHRTRTTPFFSAGFTLIELLVVIAIIGILSSVVLTNLNSSRAKARDTKRIADVKSLQLALVLYFDINAKYPAQASWTTDLAPTYITVLPKDPSSNADYTYTALPASCSGSGCNDYLLQTTLEISTNQVLTSDADTSNGAIYDVKP